VSQFKETGFQLDPKKRPATVKVGGRVRLADPRAGISGSDKDELLERYEATMEQAAKEIQKLKKKLRGRVDPSASLVPRRYHGAVSGARKDLAKATGGKVGDYENDFRMAEVPGLLINDPRLLCYPPFADMFVHYLYQGDPAEVRKTLLSLHKQALQRQASGLRAMRIWGEKLSGKPIAEIARDEKLSVSMVRKRLCEARLLFDPEGTGASAWVLAHGGGRRKVRKHRERRPAIP
jgi:hypothetical protein